MDVYLHTGLALGCLGISYYCGMKSTGFSVDTIITHMLDSLERGGYVATDTDSEGDKELIPISELIAKAVREAKKTLDKG